MTNIHPTAIIEPGAQLGVEVEIGAYSVIRQGVRIGDRTRIMPHVHLDGETTIGCDCVIFPFASIGTQTQDLKYKGGRTFVEIGDRTTLREYVTVNAGTEEGEVTRVGAGCLLMAYVHVAHKCQVGNGVIISNGTQMAGHVQVEDQAVISGLVAIHQFTRIGRLAMVGGMSRVTQDVPPFMLAEGTPLTIHGINRVGLERRGVPPETQADLKKAFRLLYREGLSTRQALDRIRAELPAKAEVEHLIRFIETSERGIVK